MKGHRGTVMATTKTRDTMTRENPPHAEGAETGEQRCHGQHVRDEATTEARPWTTGLRLAALLVFSLLVGCGVTPASGATAAATRDDSAADSGELLDAGEVDDAGSAIDASSVLDGGVTNDGGVASDGGGASGAGHELDAGIVWDGGNPTDWFFGTDCPRPAPSAVPPSAPRILIIGEEPYASGVAEHLQAMLSADPTLTAPKVISQPFTVAGAAYGSFSLMNFFYLADRRTDRLAILAENWSHVVLLEANGVAASYPEFYFEGVRALGCLARAGGARPVVLMGWSPGTDEAATVGAITYRVANGTGSVVAPAGYAREAARAVASPLDDDDGLFIAAATLYSTVTNKDAAAIGYRPARLPAERATRFAGIARETVVLEARRAHYEGAFRGFIQMEQLAPGGDFWFMASGSSSEQIWYDRMLEIVARAGWVPQGTSIGFTNPHKRFDYASLQTSIPHFQNQQYSVLFARGYDLRAETIATDGAQTKLQIHIWDRHFDNDSSDGLSAVNTMQPRLTDTYEQARAGGFVLIPYHLMFAKLKTARPSVALLTDGTHATYPVGYGLATMSLVARTGVHFSTDGLDSDTALAAMLAEETIRQLAALSVTGAYVPDDPRLHAGW
jgi:hypothetical protein